MITIIINGIVIGASFAIGVLIIVSIVWMIGKKAPRTSEDHLEGIRMQWEVNNLWAKKNNEAHNRIADSLERMSHPAPSPSTSHINN